MAVVMTSALRRQLVAVGVDPEGFIAEFAKWKADPRNEFESKLFGRDGAYIAPKIDGERYVLRHVHIIPLPRSPQRQAWMKGFAYRRNKNSDRHLVYVSDRQRGHLLIYILDEPDAHAIARMQTPKDRRAMEQFAIVAENFIIDGDVP